MAETGLPKFWRLKESIRPVAQGFIEKNPVFEDLILSYCTEIDQHGPSNATKYLQALFTQLDQFKCLDKKKAFFLGKISKRAYQNATNGKKISTRTVIETYKASYISFAMKYFLRKYTDKTLSHAQVFEEEEVNMICKRDFIRALNQEFAVAHPEETKLIEEHGAAPKRQLKDLRFGSLLEVFRHDNPQFQPGLRLLVDAASTIGENSALSDPSTRCVLQFLFLPLSQLPLSSREVSAVPSPPPRARFLLGHRLAEGRTGLRRIAETFSLPLSQLVRVTDLVLGCH